MKNMWKQFILTVLLGVFVLTLSGCGGITVDLNKYLTIETSGYDSMGKASISFNYSAFQEDYQGKIKANIKDQGGDAAVMSMELSFGAEPIDVLLGYCTDFTADKVEGLSNGDVIRIVWNCEDQYAKDYFNCNLKYSDIEYKVQGLEEVESFDPFEFVTVEIEGIAPDGFVTITPNYDKKESQYIQFSADKSYGLSNGDTVVVSANIQGDIESFIQQFHSIPNPLTKEYVVKDLPYYIHSAAEIKDTSMNTIKQQAEDAYKTRWNELEGNMDGFKQMTYLGNYFLDVKDRNSFRIATNLLYLVYKVDCTYEGVDYPHYVYIRYSDISIDGTGECVVDYSRNEMTSERWYPDGYLFIYYHGFGTLNELYNNCVVPNMDAFIFENNVSE